MAGTGAPGPAGPMARAKGLMQNKTMLIVTGVVLAAAGGLALYHKHQVAKTPAAATTTAPTTSTDDTSMTDLYNELEQQIRQLQGPGGSGTTQTAPPPPPPSPPPVQTPPPGGTQGGPPATAPTATWTYTVVSGDSLSSIASRNPTPVSLATLLQMNPTYTTNPKYAGGNTIFAGDHVVLPGSGPLK